MIFFKLKIVLEFHAWTIHSISTLLFPFPFFPVFRRCCRTRHGAACHADVCGGNFCSGQLHLQHIRLQWAVLVPATWRSRTCISFLGCFGRFEEQWAFFHIPEPLRCIQLPPSDRTPEQRLCLSPHESTSRAVRDTVTVMPLQLHKNSKRATAEVELYFLSVVMLWIKTGPLGNSLDWSLPLSSWVVLSKPL